MNSESYSTQTSVKLRCKAGVAQPLARRVGLICQPRTPPPHRWPSLAQR